MNKKVFRYYCQEIKTGKTVKCWKQNGGAFLYKDGKKIPVTNLVQFYELLDVWNRTGVNWKYWSEPLDN